MKRTIDPLLVTISASLLILSFPGYALSGLAWVSLVPLLCVVRRVAPARAFILSFAAGTIFYWSLLSWALNLQGFHLWNFALGNLVNALWVALFGIAANCLYRRFPASTVLTIPSAWVLCEYAKLHASWLSFPWGVLGASQATVLPVIQVASLAGVYGVSFLIVMVNAAFVEAANASARGRAIVPLAACAAILFGSLTYGGWRLRDSADGAREKVVAIQANTVWNGGKNMKRRLAVLEAHRRLTLDAKKEKPALIAWPSDSVPALLPRDKLFSQLVAKIAEESGTYLLVGSSGQEKFEALPGTAREPANSAFLLSPSGKLVGRYDKIRLLPFDEYLPLRNWLTWPEWIARSRPTDFRPGSELNVFDTAGTRFGVLICWENLFPDLFRRLAAKDLDYMVSMTNESFTDSPVAHRQMLAMNALRAVENHVSIVRTSTTGISAFIDPMGRVRSTIRDGNGTEVGIAGRLVSSVPLTRARTFYTRAGDWFVGMLAALLAALILVPLRMPRIAEAPSPALTRGMAAEKGP
jgi:apolipoprotein N-acyltransferase